MKLPNGREPNKIKVEGKRVSYRQAVKPLNEYAPDPTYTPSAGWLSPEGLFFPCGTGRHQEFVDAYCEFFGLEVPELNIANYNDIFFMDITYLPLLERGWLHVGVTVGETYGLRMNKAIETYTMAQHKALWQIYLNAAKEGPRGIRPSITDFFRYAQIKEIP